MDNGRLTKFAQHYKFKINRGAEKHFKRWLWSHNRLEPRA